MVKWTPLLAVLFLILPACAEIEIISSHGETWITWEWDTGSSNATLVYVDGALKLQNTSMEYYYLTDIAANEEHRIDLYEYINNTTAFMGSNVAKTTKQSWFAYIVLVLAVTLALISMLLKNPAEVLLVGLICLLMSFYLAANTWSQLGPISFMGVGLIIFSGVWITKSLWDMASKKAAWW